MLCVLAKLQCWAKYLCVGFSSRNAKSVSSSVCVRVRGESVQLPEGRANSWRFQTCLNFLGGHVLQCKHSYAQLITQNTPSYSQRLSKTIIMGALRQICLKITPDHKTGVNGPAFYKKRWKRAPWVQKIHIFWKAAEVYKWFVKFAWWEKYY